MERYFIWVTAGALLLLGIEVIAGRHRGVYRKGDLPLLIGSALGRVMVAPVASLLVASLYGFCFPNYKNAWSGTPIWVSFPIVLLAMEFCFYWVHRSAHNMTKFPILWKIHRAHHSGAHMNMSVYLRLNVFWYFIIPHAWTAGLALYLGWTDAAIAALLCIASWNVITHSNFRWDDAIRRHRIVGPAFRALEHVLVSPGIHHTHHGFGRDGRSYRNFGVMLSIYDWMFGTLHIPEGRPANYGLPGKPVHWTEELLYPLVRRSSKEPDLS